MIIRIENIGPVKKVDIDLSKPLIVFTGLNGTGKTYVLYVLYAILKMFILEKDYLHWADIVNSHQKNKTGELDIDELYMILQKHMEDVNSLLCFYIGVDYKDDLIKDTKLSLLTSKEQFRKEIFSKEYVINAEGSFSFKKKENTLKYSFTDVEGSLDEAGLVNYVVVKGLLFNTILEDIEPSDRSGLSTFNNEIIKGHEISYLEKKNKKSLNQKRLNEQPLAIRRFLSDMKDRLEQLSDSPKYAFLADEIENDIMHGHLRASKSGGIYYQKEGMNKEIPLLLSSSGVKTICSIILFLRNTAMDCNLIIIDEPEINLHPKYQVLIARVLAKIVNAGIRVIISTHSDYIIRELNNMIMLSSIKDDKTITKLGYKKMEALSKDVIAPYYFEYQEKKKYVLGKEAKVSETGFSISEIDEVINSQVEASQNIYETIENL